MDQFSNLVQLIAAFVSTVLLPLILIKSQHKKSAAEAEKSEADNITAYAAEWKDLYEKKEERVAAQDLKIDALYAEINLLREQLRDAYEKNTQLAIQNQSLEVRKCNKRGCPDRLPPSEY